MADEGGVHDVVPMNNILAQNNIMSSKASNSKSSVTEDGEDLHQPPTYRQPRADSGNSTPMHSKRQSSGTMHMLNHDERNLERYFAGPRDLDRHSKLPYFMRMHGSILPKMIVPLLLIGGEATLITCITKYVHNCKEIGTMNSIWTG